MVAKCHDEENIDKKSIREESKIETLCLSESSIRVEQKEILKTTDLRYGKERKSSDQHQNCQTTAIIKQRTPASGECTSIKPKEKIHHSREEPCEPDESSVSDEDWKEALPLLTSLENVNVKQQSLTKNGTKCSTAGVCSTENENVKQGAQTFRQKDCVEPMDVRSDGNAKSHVRHNIGIGKCESQSSKDIKTYMHIVDKVHNKVDNDNAKIKSRISEIETATHRHSNDSVYSEKMKNDFGKNPVSFRNTETGVESNEFDERDGGEMISDQNYLNKSDMDIGISKSPSQNLPDEQSGNKSSKDLESQKYSKELHEPTPKDIKSPEQKMSDGNIAKIRPTKTSAELYGKHIVTRKDVLVKNEELKGVNENRARHKDTSRKRKDECSDFSSGNLHISYAIADQERKKDEDMSMSKRWMPYKNIKLNPKDNTMFSSALKVISGLFCSKKFDLNSFKIVSTQQVGNYCWSEAYSPGCLFSKDRPLLNIWSVEWDGISKSRKKAIISSSNVLDTLKGHSGIPHHFMSLEGKKRFYQVLEKVSDLTLDEMVGKSNPFEFNEILSLNLIEKVVDVVYYMHRHGTSHGGLSPYTIRVSTENHQFPRIGNGFNVRLVSFHHGTRWNPAIYTTTDALHYSGCKSFAAPETASGSYDVVKADVYSIGALLYYIISNERLHQYTCSGNSTLQTSHSLDKVSMPGKWDNISPSTRSLIFSCLETDVKKRLTVQEMKKKVSVILNVQSERSFAFLK